MSTLTLFKKLAPPPIVSLYHFLWAFGSALFYGFPSRRLIVIGVTGTKGKTTVTELLAKILETGGHKAAVANGLHFKIGDAEEPNMAKMTMPGRGRIQRFLRRAVDAGCTYAILEVTSEGIRQHRHRFIKFDVAAITNLHKEHIEAHGSFEAYREAKGKLFRTCGNTHVLNADDPHADYFRQFPAKRKLEFSGQDFENFRAVQPPSLPGEFNLYNIACASKIAESLGVSEGAIKSAIRDFPGVPGRMEFMQREPFEVVVDYAHTPDSLEAVYKTIGYTLHPNRLICVFGAAGGGRDKWKRPVMGKLAARYCDEVVLTNEDPYDELPEGILRDIEVGLLATKNEERRTKNVKKILDRKEAILLAIESARSGDVVVITGKGAEKWMMFAKGKKTPWDDREVVRQALAQR